MIRCKDCDKEADLLFSINIPLCNKCYGKRLQETKICGICKATKKIYDHKGYHIDFTMSSMMCDYCYTDYVDGKIDLDGAPIIEKSKKGLNNLM